VTQSQPLPNPNKGAWTNVAPVLDQTFNPVRLYVHMDVNEVGDLDGVDEIDVDKANDDEVNVKRSLHTTTKTGPTARIGSQNRQPRLHVRIC